MPCRTYPDPRWIRGTDNRFNVRDPEPKKASRGDAFYLCPRLLGGVHSVDRKAELRGLCRIRAWAYRASGLCSGQDSRDAAWLSGASTAAAACGNDRMRIIVRRT